MNAKVIEVKNKILGLIDLIKMQIMMLKYRKPRENATSDYNKFTSDILDKKIKQKELVKKSDNSELATKLTTLATKTGLKAERDKIVKFRTFDSIYFHGKHFFVMMVFENMLVYQSVFNLTNLKLKKDKNTEYVIGS